MEEPGAADDRDLQQTTRLPEPAPARRRRGLARRGEDGGDRRRGRSRGRRRHGGRGARGALGRDPRRQRSRRLLRRRDEPPQRDRQPVLPGRRPHPRQRPVARVSAPQGPGAPAGACLEAEVRPPWPYRLPGGGGGDAVMRVRGGVVSRLLHVDGEPIVVRAWQRRDGRVAFRRGRARAPARRASSSRWRSTGCASRSASTTTTASSTTRFRSDRLLGTRDPARTAGTGPRRRPWAWEALAWSIIKQLIESSRAAEIQRRMVLRWGRRRSRGRTARRFATSRRRS